MGFKFAALEGYISGTWWNHDRVEVQYLLLLCTSCRTPDDLSEDEAKKYPEYCADTASSSYSILLNSRNRASHKELFSQQQIYMVK